MLGGGLALGDLHEVRAAESRDGACAAGFLAALMAQAGAAGAGSAGAGSAGAGSAGANSGGGAIVWISEADRRREAGELYPPGLAALGLDPGRIIRIAAPRTADALWTFEAALACRGVAFAVCEVRRRARCLDLTATRRLALRAQASGATGFLLRLAEAPEPTAAMTRLLIAPSPSGYAPSGPVPPGAGQDSRFGGRPAWRVSLEKARFGRTGSFRLEWNADERRFAEQGAEHEQPDDSANSTPGDSAGAGGARPGAGADPVAVAAEAFDRPADPDRQSAA
jgi:protein ImuA